MNQIAKATAAIGSVKVTPMTPEIISKLILTGDVSQLQPTQKVEYITKLCERVGLDPLTQPFKLIKMQGREVLYADKGATQQLCQVHNISTEVTKKEMMEGVYIVTVRAKNATGRFTDEDGAVTISGLSGDALCNAFMKAITKAKRRAVLALCGLGMLDETEIETCPSPVHVEMPTPTAVEMPVISTETPQEGDIGIDIDTWDGVIPEPVKTEPMPKKQGAVISEPQAKRFFAISKGAGMSDDSRKELISRYGYEHSRDILKADYEAICKEAEAYNPIGG